MSKTTSDHATMTHGMSHRHHSDRAATRDDRNDGCGAPYLSLEFSVAATAMGLSARCSVDR